MFNFATSQVKADMLRDFLATHEYEASSLVGIRKSELVELVKTNNLVEEFENWFNNDVEIDEEEEVDESEYTEVEKPSPLLVRGTKEWNEHVLSLFSDEERVKYTTSSGRQIDAVRADGLRRVGELVLGRIIYSGPVASTINYNGPKGLPCANVQYKIVVEKGGLISEFQSLGEVSYFNTEDEFLGFALLTAETRAKGRAWREALGVKTYAIEEFSGKKDTAAAVVEVSSADWKEQPISTFQQRTIKNMSSKLNIDVLKLLNSTGKLDKEKNFIELKYDSSKVDKYDGLDDETLMNNRASLLIRGLNQMQQGSLKIDESLLLS